MANSSLLILMTIFCLIFINNSNESSIGPHMKSITNNGNKSNRSAINGGIYFSDIPLSDTEGSADGTDDLDESASGKGEDDEDTKDMINKEGSGKGSENDTEDDTEDGDDEKKVEGSGEDIFITQRPTIRPEVTKIPETTTHENRVTDSEQSYKKPNIEDIIDTNDIMATDLRPIESSTRSPISPAKEWPPEVQVIEENNLNNEVSIMGQKQMTPVSFFARPGILAAVIGGAVVGLLCAILLVMFIVYRMRKKDEGSYALDEHKRTTSGHPYTRGASKELYA